MHLPGGEEQGTPETWRFSIDVAKAWEDAATEIELPHTRTVLMRSAMVMSPDRGGVFDVLLRLVRLGLGGTNGDGQQFVSWIHDADFIAAIDWLIEHQAPAEMPARWEEHVAAMQNAARDVLNAQDVASAANATSRLGLACGSCHTANNVTVSPGSP